METGQFRSNEDKEIEEILRISRQEEEQKEQIKAFVRDRSKLKNVLRQLPGVNPDDPRFEQFFE